VEFGPFSAEFGVVDVVCAIWHGGSFGVFCWVVRAAEAAVHFWGLYAALKRRSSTSLHSLAMCLGNKKRDPGGRVAYFDSKTSISCSNG
jgi:hypothetical protein